MKFTEFVDVWRLTCFLGLTNSHTDACYGHWQCCDPSSGDHSWHRDHWRLGERHLGRLACLGLNLALSRHASLGKQENGLKNKIKITT